jgi:hypothetical protein
MSKLTTLASAQLTNTDHLTVVLVEPADMPASVIIHWPSKPTVVHPRDFSAAADCAVKVFAAAIVKLAQVRRGW